MPPTGVGLLSKYGLRRGGPHSFFAPSPRARGEGVRGCGVISNRRLGDETSPMAIGGIQI